MGQLEDVASAASARSDSTGTVLPLSAAGKKQCIQGSRFKVQGFFICHMINYTGYNQK